MKKVCETCAVWDNASSQGDPEGEWGPCCLNPPTLIVRLSPEETNNQAAVDFDPLGHYPKTSSHDSCGQWTPREIGTCGECRWWDWRGSDQKEADDKGCCLVRAPSGSPWFPATAIGQVGCGDWEPKPEGDEDKP